MKEIKITCDGCGIELEQKNVIEDFADVLFGGKSSDIARSYRVIVKDNKYDIDLVTCDFCQECMNKFVDALKQTFPDEEGKE